jgi:hypothetical protein
VTRSVRWFGGPLTLGGVEIRVAAVVDDQELSRRDRLAPVEPVSRETLEALFILPEDVVSADDSLPTWASNALRSAPAWAVERRPDGWRRMYRPPAHVFCVGSANGEASVDEQLAELEWLSAICPRLVVVGSIERAVEGLDRATASAAGVAVTESASVCWMVAPPSSSRVRLTAQRWWLAERVADLRGSAGVPIATPWPSDRD